MSNIKSLFSQSSHYFYGRIFTMAASLISFPILTRVLSVPEYGTFGLLSIVIYLVVSISKTGMQNSNIRFFNEYKYVIKRPEVYYSTFFFSPLIIAAAVSVIYALLIVLVFKHFLPTGLNGLLLLCAPIIFLKTLYALYNSFFRAEQRTKMFNVVMTSEVVLNIGLGIVFLFLFHNGIWSVMQGHLVADVLILIFILIMVFRDYGRYLRIRHNNRDLLRKSLAYGLPLMGHEFTNNLLIFGDRFVISVMLSGTALGFYTAASNLSTQVAAILAVPISFAITPIYMKLFVTDGKEATQRFLTKSLKYTLMASFPCILGFSAMGKEILSIFASEKYIQANSLIPYLTSATILFYGLTNIFNAGILIEKKSMISFAITLGAGLVNIGLNFSLVAVMGVEGAALATLLTCAVLIAVTAFFSFKYVRFNIPFNDMIRYALYSIVMYAGMIALDLHSDVINIIVKSIAGFIVYVSFILCFEKEMREKVRLLLIKAGGSHVQSA